MPNTQTQTQTGQISKSILTIMYYQSLLNTQTYQINRQQLIMNNKLHLQNFLPTHCKEGICKQGLKNRRFFFFGFPTFEIKRSCPEKENSSADSTTQFMKNVLSLSLLSSEHLHHSLPITTFESQMASDSIPGLLLLREMCIYHQQQP